MAAHRHSGEEASFDALVHRHRHGVLRLVLSVLGPELQADAEDVVQLIFVRAHQRLGGFLGESRLGTWLHRIAYNLAIDHKRTHQRRRRLLRESSLGRRDEPRPPALSPEHAESIRRALVEVPEPYQTALRLHYWLGHSVTEIADLLDVAGGTAKSYLHRGRKRLHRLLEEKGLLP